MKHLFLLLCLLSITSCNRTKENDNNNFDRKDILTNISDNILLPGYTKLRNDNINLQNKINQFSESLDIVTLSEARIALIDAYKTWETVAPFEIGTAESENLRVFFNSYPTNTDLIENLALSNTYNLDFLSNSAKQGYPALLYMLYGSGNSDTAILQKYTTDINANKYLNFINALSQRLVVKSTTVIDQWENGYRDSFIDNDGSSSNASLDQIANAYLLFYEKDYKTNKIATPLGENIDSAKPESVEGYHYPSLSSELFDISTKSLHNFYEGKSYDETSNGPSFKSYLINMNKTDIANEISANFETILQANSQVTTNYANAVINDRASMSYLYESIENNLLPMKVDMLQAMNITVAYFDGDGD